METTTTTTALNHKRYGIDFVWMIKTLGTKTISPTLRGKEIVDPAPIEYTKYPMNRVLPNFFTKKNGEIFLYLPDRVLTFKNAEEYRDYKEKLDKGSDVTLKDIKQEINNDLKFGSTGTLSNMETYKQKAHLHTYLNAMYEEFKGTKFQLFDFLDIKQKKEDANKVSEKKDEMVTTINNLRKKNEKAKLYDIVLFLNKNHYSNNITITRSQLNSFDIYELADTCKEMFAHNYYNLDGVSMDAMKYYETLPSDKKHEAEFIAYSLDANGSLKIEDNAINIYKNGKLVVTTNILTNKSKVSDEDVVNVGKYIYNNPKILTELTK